MAVAIGIVTLAILVVMAGYLAASETALMRVSRIRVRYLAEKKVKKSDKLERLIEDPDWFLPPLLLMVLIVQLSSASLATWITTRITHNAGIGVLVGTAAVAVFMFIFGELIPKAAASHDSERVALGVTRPITFMSRLLHPVALLFEYAAKGVLKVIGLGDVAVDRIVSDEGEIKAMVSEAEKHDVIEEEEKEMIHSVFEFGDTLAREVMVPRPDMVTLPATATVMDALALTIEHGFSRIPVYEGDLDNVIGILYAKDLMSHLREGRLDAGIKEMVREAYFIPETKVLSDLLKELQRRKVHMAIVVDEYGTVTGLVTIEDLLEEIVGEIFDEFDREVKLIEQIAPNKYTLDSRVSIDDLNELLGTELPSEGVDSVGGLVLKVLREVPQEGETFVLDGVAFTVQQVKNNRISKVVIELVRGAVEDQG
jgi:CBS domain containing-hemolysin-like protein